MLSLSHSKNHIHHRHPHPHHRSSAKKCGEGKSSKICRISREIDAQKSFCRHSMKELSTKSPPTKFWEGGSRPSQTHMLAKHEILRLHTTIQGIGFACRLHVERRGHWMVGLHIPSAAGIAAPQCNVMPPSLLLLRERAGESESMHRSNRGRRQVFP